jgi:hypothetical protein
MMAIDGNDDGSFAMTAADDVGIDRERIAKYNRLLH